MKTKTFEHNARYVGH